jgi:hypothetical protein
LNKSTGCRGTSAPPVIHFSTRAATSATITRTAFPAPPIAPQYRAALLLYNDDLADVGVVGCHVGVTVARGCIRKTGLWRDAVAMSVVEHVKDGMPGWGLAQVQQRRRRIVLLRATRFGTVCIALRLSSARPDPSPFTLTADAPCRPTIPCYSACSIMVQLPCRTRPPHPSHAPASRAVPRRRGPSHVVCMADD